MTANDIKKLVLFMKSEGVQQFSTEGLQVSFHPRALNFEAQATASDTSQPNLDAMKLPGDLDIEALMPRAPDMPDAEVPR